MPLLIDGTPCPKQISVDKFVHLYPQYKNSSKPYLEQKVKTVGPESLLYIGQREVACTTPSDDTITYLGSEDATTCHIAVLRHSGSGATSLIHLDGSQIDEGLQLMADTVTNISKDSPSGGLELHLFGGFLDNKENSKEVSDSILDHNTVHHDSVPFPVVYGIAVNVKTGEMFQATFPDKGPDLPLRNARHFTGGSENLNIYNPVSKELVIPPFHYDRLDNVDLFLSLSDQDIRKYMSTSPKQEKDGFAESVRASLKQLKDFPDPLKTVFTGGLPRRYKKDSTNGAWVKIE